jgi:outer membrane protein assembly factor BamB
MHLGLLENDNTDYLFLPYFQRGNNDSTRGDGFLSLYDITNREYIYDSIPLIGRVSTFGPTTIYNNRLAFINASDHVFGIDIMTGEIIWDTGFIDQGGFSLHMVDDILIMGQYFGSVSYMYGKDPETGKTLWRTENGGGAEELQSHNGIVYWVDRGDGKLWAMEAKTGEVLWKIDRPDPESDSWFVHGKLGILPGENGEKGKLFASTYRRLYCYELIR